ncbi:MAG: SpoIIE family protein phosphatase [Thermacetogeniaceae bacterium]
MGAEYAWLRQGISGRWPQVKGIALCLLYAVLGIAAGRSQIGGLTPFALPLAVAAAFLAAPLGWAVVVGVVVGVFAHAGTGQFFLPVGDALAVTAAFLLTRTFRDRARRVPAGTRPSGRGEALGGPLLSGALTAGGINILVKSIFLLSLNRNPGVLPYLVSESALASLFTPVAIYGFTDVAGIGERQRELWGLLALVLVMCGLGDLHIGPATLQDLLARSVLITVAYGWGAGWGAGAGVILGLLGGNWQMMLPRTGFYAGTGFFAGALKGFGRTGVIVGFFLASLLFSIFYNDPGELSGHLLASLLTVGVFFLASPFINRVLGRERPETLLDLPLEVEVGFSQRSKSTEPFCGDSFAVTHHSPGHLLLTVSDGMGAGVNAMRESRIVVTLLEQLISNGITPEAAAGIVNTALYLRGGEESAATIDLAAVDLDGRYVDFLKAGAPPSFLKRDHSVEMIRSSCWPAGILDKVEAEVYRRQVLPGDMLIMATDGVTEVDRSAALPDNWLYEFLQELPLEDAQAVADLVLKHALRAVGLKNRDDMTVLVARFGTAPELG